ncbi:Protein of unknown function [Jatrophihabitans endophyticus]|uniref:DUF2550 domain-containing protein n=1 Tax=Jatrophihabitans endophyticus TaxID=1206085 RepID=A0A1M5DJ33_9ACTN|nr:DUF2550 domain-containing protein [Jatrophihabitans endophyticus]SHF66993.1 Protein of unknown function [Jatrophihabitans endophyticus]
MHTVDLIAVCAAVLVVCAFAFVLARQRYMLRLSGAVPFAVQRGQRWLYGIGRYQGGELRWYRALGVGTRPSRVLRQGQVEVLARRTRLPAEANSLPPSAVIVECRAEGETFSLALGESAYTGFVSWLESSAPRA